jgi:alpha-D-ribose 1-methylphosphonate 5-triphosphate synthase subunit PhnG
MLQSADSHTKNLSNKRSQWMALFARAPLELLEQALGDLANQTPQWLRKPETGLMMIEARAGGTGARFNLGEVTITRCALRLANMPMDAPVGIAYVLGRSHRHVRLAAMLDAIFLSTADEAYQEQTLAPIKQHLQAQRINREERTATSKVEFFTVARESGVNDEAEE